MSLAPCGARVFASFLDHPKAGWSEKVSLVFSAHTSFTNHVLTSHVPLLSSLHDHGLQFAIAFTRITASAEYGTCAQEQAYHQNQKVNPFSIFS